MNIQEKIKELENEISTTKKNKATETHLGLLKAKLSRLRRELLFTKQSGSTEQGFEVSKTGVARIGFIGFPSVGKSTLMSKLTGTFSAVAEYEFTTLTTVPGILKYNNAKIQILDLPGIIEGAREGKGRGKQVLSVARTCSLLMIVLDSTKPMTCKSVIEKELECVGIRLNKEKPNIKISKKLSGGVNVVGNLDLNLTKNILKEYRIMNAEVVGNGTVDDLIDVLEDNRTYVPAIYVLNKVDKITLEELKIISQIPNSIPISSHLEWNFENLLKFTWKRLNLVRIYPKPKNQPVDEDPIVLKKDKSKVKDFCNAIHKAILPKFKYALVWGTSVKHNPQKVGKDHQLHDSDVVQIIKSV